MFPIPFKGAQVAGDIMLNFVGRHFFRRERAGMFHGNFGGGLFCFELGDCSSPNESSLS